MAKYTGILPLIGTFDNISFYKRRDIEGIIARRKGGPSREDIKKKKNFHLTRLNNHEFAGRSVASRHIMRQLFMLKPLADYNIAGPLNSLLRHLQVNDPINGKGKRSLHLSKSPQLLEGFNFNRKETFDSMVRYPFSYVIEEEAGKARVSIPELMPGIHLRLEQKQQPLFGFIIVFGLVPDFETDGKYYTQVTDSVVECAIAETEWYPTSKGSKASQVELQLKDLPKKRSYTMVLGIGVKFGTMGNDGVLEQVKYTGAAKVMAVRGVA